MSSTTVAGEDIVMELTTAMEGVTLPSDVVSHASAAAAASAAPPPPPPQRLERTNRPPPPPPLLIDPAKQPTRPFDILAQRPPADPIGFPRARYSYGKRADVLCYNPETDQHEVVKNVLFRDYTRRTSITEQHHHHHHHHQQGTSNNTNDAGDCRVREAYWRVPYKQPIRTIMGHVEICLVLERCLPQKEDNSEESDSENSENSSSCGYGDDYEEEDDIVFQWTKRRVAIKVNYYDRMERLRNRHAEDPLKEIAAMQLIGDEHPNVLGCREVLFDGKNLNVVMRYCDSGDLFQLLQDNQGGPDSPPGLPEGQIRYWFRQIMAGVEHLHQVGICHRDLSPENVMIDDGGSLIIDMGMCLRVPYMILLPPSPERQQQEEDARREASFVDVQRARRFHNANNSNNNASNKNRQPQRCLIKPQGACGKLPYMSPEIYKNRTCFDGSAADVWTCGTILFCMVTGNRSYQRPHSSDPQFYWMTRGLTQLLSDWQIQLSPQGEHLLQNMLQTDPRLRLTLEEVVHHPWFAMPDEPPPNRY